MFGKRNTSVAPRQSTWPVLLLVLLAVIAPSAGVLWFMEQAVRNEQLVVRQRLAELYRGRLVEAQSKLDDYWKTKLSRLDETAKLSASRAFVTLVSDRALDTLLTLDEPQADPRTTETALDQLAEPGWQPAVELEYEQGRFAEAAARYAGLASLSSDPQRAARALLAQARCLVKDGKADAAATVLRTILTHPVYAKARSLHDESITDDARLMLLHLPNGMDRPGGRSAANDLVARVTNYEEPMPAARRLFLMNELRSLIQPPPDFPTFDAQQLAADLADQPMTTPFPTAGNVRFDRPRHLWMIASSDGSRIGVVRDAAVQQAMQAAIAGAVGAEDVEVRLVESATDPLHSENFAFLTLSAGRFLPDHRLVLILRGANKTFTDAAHRRIVLHTWTAWIGVLLIGTFGLLLARYVTRQIRLTRLKNDLVATVSHELKTPLASMRILVETLASGHCRDDNQVKEYYALLEHENERLSRLIDNFLTFSRMERNKQAFNSSRVKVTDIIQTAVQAMRDRLAPPDCELTIDLASDLPDLCGDRDALITVILNLLDNAFKYSSTPRRIAINGHRLNGDIVLQVQDNGIGLTRRAARRVFDRFYQVDQSLSRRTGGCGLGLSIVKFIVSSHNGSVFVSSEPGRGSTFTVRLPAIPGAVLAAEENVHA